MLPPASGFIDAGRRVPFSFCVLGGAGGGSLKKKKTSSFALERLPPPVCVSPPPNPPSLYVSHVPAPSPPPSLLTALFQSFHPSSQRGAGSRWISVGAKCTVCACQSLSAICRGGVVPSLKPVLSLSSLSFFSVRHKLAIKEEGTRGSFLPCVVIGVLLGCFFSLIFIVCILCCVASWLNDSCAVPLTFSSLLFVSPLCLSVSLTLPVVFLSPFFRTNLHACLLIISLACLHDVESQAKTPPGLIIPPLSVMSL